MFELGGAKPNDEVLLDEELALVATNKFSR
jgi:hypothetical protein